MKTCYTFLLLWLGLALTTNAQQPAAPDTASFPYWISMMQDPNANFYSIQRAFNTYWDHHTIRKACGWKPFKRWEYMMKSRVAPDGTLPLPDAVYRAMEKYEAGHPKSLTGNWTSLGPAVIPAPGPAGYEGLGRINTVAFHPSNSSLIYIGAPSGGMWSRTIPSVSAWTNHTDQLSTLGVSAVVLNYTNPSHILIGTGDRDAGDAPGMGVFASTDGGTTWIPSNTGMGNLTVSKLLQHPSNPQIFLAATSGGVYRSTDGGVNWTKTNGGNVKDITFKPGDPGIVYAAMGADFYRSVNNGVTFVKISNGLPSGQQRGAIAVTPANSQYVYFIVTGNDSGLNGIYRSTDSGLTFTPRATTPNIMDWSCDGSGSGGQGWYDLALAADPANPNILYAGGVDVWKSTDGGSSWTINSHWYGGCGVPAVHADCHYLTFSPSGKLFACNDGGVWMTEDGGITWTDFTTGLTIGQIYKLGQAQQVKDHVINGFQDNGTYSLTPSGWLATGGGDGMECAIDPVNDGYSYHTLYYGDIYRKYNNGIEYHIGGEGVGGIDESGDWVTPFVLHRTTPEVMFAGYKNVWRNKNARVNPPVWTKISDNLAGNNNSNIQVLENSKADPDILYMSRSDQRLFRSDNVNATAPAWVDLTSGLPTGSTITDIESHPTDPETVYITAGNQVFRSTDRGQNWMELTGNLPDIHLNTITFYKNDLEGLYVGSDAGVYYRNAGMTGWISFSQGLPQNGRITELEIYYDNDSVSADALRASTYGRGLWSSDLYHAAPDANFSADRTLVPPGCPVNFTDSTAGIPTYWQWTFTGGSPAVSALKNPQGILYNLPGTYPVKLKVWNEAGSDSITKTGYITIDNTLLPAVQFSADRTVLCPGETVQFADATENCPASWNWSFDPSTVTYLNGTSPASQNPAVQFDQNGAYSVTLTAHNAAGTNSLTKTAYIMQGGYALPFTEDFAGGIGAHSWTVVNPDQAVGWDTITLPLTQPVNTVAWMNLFNYGSFFMRDQLVSPPVSLSGMQSAQLDFRHAYAQRGNLKDSLLVDLSPDCGETWVRILAEGPNGTPGALVTHAPLATAFYPETNDDWCSGTYGVECYSVDLTPWAGLPTVKIRFETYNRMGNNLYLDDIEVTGVVAVADRNPDTRLQPFPNPSDGLIRLESPGTAGPSVLTVSDTRGAILLTLPLQPGMNTIDLSHLAKGIYLLRLTTESITKTGKIILD